MTLQGVVVFCLLGLTLGAPQSRLKTTTDAAGTSTTSTTSQSALQAKAKEERVAGGLLYNQLASPYRQLFPGSTTYRQFVLQPEYNTPIGYNRQVETNVPATRGGSLLGVAYSPATQVSHMVFDGFGIKYEY